MQSYYDNNHKEFVLNIILKNLALFLKKIVFPFFMITIIFQTISISKNLKNRRILCKSLFKKI